MTRRRSSRPRLSGAARSTWAGLARRRDELALRDGVVLQEGAHWLLALEACQSLGKSPESGQPHGELSFSEHRKRLPADFRRLGDRSFGEMRGCDVFQNDDGFLPVRLVQAA